MTRWQPLDDGSLERPIIQVNSWLTAYKRAFVGVNLRAGSLLLSACRQASLYPVNATATCVQKRHRPSEVPSADKGCCGFYAFKERSWAERIGYHYTGTLLMGVGLSGTIRNAKLGYRAEHQRVEWIVFDTACHARINGQPCPFPASHVATIDVRLLNPHAALYSVCDRHLLRLNTATQQSLRPLVVHQTYTLDEVTAVFGVRAYFAPAVEAPAVLSPQLKRMGRELRHFTVPFDIPLSPN